MKIKFGSRAYGEWAGQPAAHWSVEEMTWRAKGGPDLAWMRAPVGVDSMEKWIDLLRRPVEVYEDGGRLAWWGYAATVEVWRGAAMVSFSLDDLVNKVIVQYQEYIQGVVNTHTSTTTNPSLAHLYGEKEIFVDMGFGNLVKAQAYAGGILQRYNNTRGPWKTGSPNRGTFVRVGLRGWWHSLAWRVFIDEGQGNYMAPSEWTQNLETVIGSTTAQKGWQGMLEPLEDYPAWTPLEVEYLARAEGTPGDALRVAIHKMNGSVPAATPEDYADLNISTSVNLTTYRAAFSGRTAQIKSNTKYAIMFSRTGTLSNVNRYWIGLCKSDGVLIKTPDADHEYKYWNGSAWVAIAQPSAALVQLYGGTDSADLAGYCASVLKGGQFLPSYQVEDKSGVYTVSAQNRVYDCKRQAEELLNLGSIENRMMNAEINPERVLRIYKAADQSTDDILIDARGRFIDSSGRLLGMADRIAGRWARMGAWTDAPAMFAEVVKYDGKSGVLSIAPE
jgi:hypothetical protein